MFSARSRRTGFVGATLALGLIACDVQAPPQEAPVAVPGYEGMEEFNEPLTEVAGRVFSVSGKTLTVTLADDETCILSKGSAGELLVNGYTTVSGSTTATTTNVTQVTVIGSGTAAHTLIVDYYGGTFGTGKSGAAGVIFTAGSGANKLKVRGSTGAELLTIGASGMALNNDAYVDITATGTFTITVSAGDGNDVVTGQGGYGTGAAYGSALTIYGGAGTDVLSGGDGNDALYGGDGNDTLNGKAGDDTIDGGANDDTIDQGSDADGADVISGGAGTADTVSYASRAASTTVLHVTLNNTADDGLGSEGDDVQSTVEYVNGGAGDDVITCSATVSVTGCHVSGNGGADTITGSTVADVLSGGAGNDIIDGLAGAEAIDGGDGNDWIAGGAGIDALTGGAGNDTFWEDAAANGADVFNGGAGTDTVSYASRSAAHYVSIDAKAFSGEGSSPTVAGEADKLMTDIENITGGSGVDLLYGSASANVLMGGGGDDKLYGLGGGDVLYGDAGSNELYGGDGDDTFAQGDDTMETAADLMSGGAGTDTADYSLRTNNLNVTLSGTAVHVPGADDDGAGSEGDDVLDDVENVSCGSGADFIYGSTSRNVLFGGAGNDTIHGGGADDTIDGGGDDNDLFGDAGDGDICFNEGSGGTLDSTCEL